MNTVRKINNLNDIDSEIARLKAERAAYHELLKADLNGIKTALKPGRLLADALPDKVKQPVEKSAFTEGIITLAGFILDRYVLKKMNMHQTVKTTARDVIVPAIIDRVRMYFRQKAHKEEQEIYEHHQQL